jgi:hypothetical protein
MGTIKHPAAGDRNVKFKIESVNFQRIGTRFLVQDIDDRTRWFILNFVQLV